LRPNFKDFAILHIMLERPNKEDEISDKEALIIEARNVNKTLFG